VDASRGHQRRASVSTRHLWIRRRQRRLDPTHFSTPVLAEARHGTGHDDPGRTTIASLNAVWESGHIWTADNTDCTPSLDTTARSVPGLRRSSPRADRHGLVNATDQPDQTHVGVNGSYLYYPAVQPRSSAGDDRSPFSMRCLRVPDENPTIVSSSHCPSGGNQRSAPFRRYDRAPGSTAPHSQCQSINSTNACRWGDYSGAAQDPANPKDVWVVCRRPRMDRHRPSCTPASECWGSDITDLTLAGPTHHPRSTRRWDHSQVDQTVTVTGFDFGTDTTATFGGNPITPVGLTPTSVSDS